MKVASLLCVLVLAKLCVVAGREVPLSVWTPIAYFWQDALVLLVFAALDRLLRPWVGWLLAGSPLFRPPPRALA